MPLEFNDKIITCKYSDNTRSTCRCNGCSWYAAAERPDSGPSTTAASAASSTPNPSRATSPGDTSPEHPDRTPAGTSYDDPRGRVPRTTQGGPRTPPSALGPGLALPGQPADEGRGHGGVLQGDALRDQGPHRDAGRAVPADGGQLGTAATAVGRTVRVHPAGVPQARQGRTGAVAVPGQPQLGHVDLLQDVSVHFSYVVYREHTTTELMMRS